MSVRIPKPTSAARILVRSLGELGISVTHRQALEMIAKIWGPQNFHAMKDGAKPNSVSNSRVPRYVLGDEKICWIEHGNVSVRVSAEDRAVRVGLYPKGREADERTSTHLDYGEAADDKTILDPSKPFYGCALPRVLIAVEFVSGDARASQSCCRCRATYVIDSLVEWLEVEEQNNDFDLSEDVIQFDDADEVGHLSGQDVVDARLDPDGRFEMKDGRELYLIDERNLRWIPRTRV